MESKSSRQPDKKQKIIEAAETVFARYGYGKTTLEDIAVSLGMKKSSLYYYFESKEDIFREVIFHEIENYRRKIKEEIKKGVTAGERLKIFFRTKNAHMRGAILRYNMTKNLALELGQVFGEIQEEIIEGDKKIIKSILDKGISSGEFIIKDTDRLASLIISVSEGLRFREFAGRQPDELSEVCFDDVDSWLEYFIQTMIEGIGKK